MYEEFLEGNKKIAEYMGYKYYPHNHPPIDGKEIIPGWKSHPLASNWTKTNTLNRLPRNSFLCRSHKGLLYHEDLNWLYDVTTKITSEGYSVLITARDLSANVVIIKTDQIKGIEIFIDGKKRTPAKHVIWKACLDFITLKNAINTV